MGELKKPRINLYIHCRNCISGQLAIGWTLEGLQIFCEKCERNVLDLDFKGQKVEVFQSSDEPDDEK